MAYVAQVETVHLKGWVFEESRFVRQNIFHLQEGKLKPQVVEMLNILNLFFFCL